MFTARRRAGDSSRLRPRDLADEALAGLLQRPGRSVLTMLGTVLGIGGFVGIVGLSPTADGPIGTAVNPPAATQDTVTHPPPGQSTLGPLHFPPPAGPPAGPV